MISKFKIFNENRIGKFFDQKKKSVVNLTSYLEGKIQTNNHFVSKMQHVERRYMHNFICTSTLIGQFLGFVFHVSTTRGTISSFGFILYIQHPFIFTILYHL